MYQALYRKWRPKGFADVCGQEHIVSVLKNEVATGRISHAYLFCGSRGTGKTTCAKILAKAVNCDNAKDGEPCGVCDICKGIDSGSILDVVEIDAASNNGVENVREIRNEVLYTPVQAKKRVYIIDEVHMLSNSAWNALLKTLEEPPDHAIFILATTEIAKIPATIISRCQHFDFKRISRQTARDRIEFICKSEGIAIEPRASELIAAASDGSMRDALSILDQCVGAGEITVARAEELCGLLPTSKVLGLAAFLVAGDFEGALAAFTELYESGRDTQGLCEALLTVFRDLMLAGAGCKDELFSCVGEDVGLIGELSKKITPEKVILMLRILSDTLDRLPKCVSKQTEFEIALLMLTRPEELYVGDALVARVSALERGRGAPPAPCVPAVKEAAQQDDAPPWEDEAEPPKAAPPKAEPPKAAPPEAEPPKAAPTEDAPPKAEPPAKAGAPYKAEVQKLLPPNIASFLRGCEISREDGHISIFTTNAMEFTMLDREDSLKAMTLAFAKVLGESVTVRVKKSAPKAASDPFEALKKGLTESDIVKFT